MKGQVFGYKFGRTVMMIEMEMMMVLEGTRLEEMVMMIQGSTTVIIIIVIIIIVMTMVGLFL